jgi:hypothetical protein
MWRWFLEFFEQDDFNGRPYGWLTNQISHTMLGLAMAFVLSLFWFVVAGEMPWKSIAWPLCVVVYLALEFVRGWNGWDSVEDTAFTAGYGSGGAFLLFSEVRIGDPVLLFNMAGAVPLAFLAFAHLVWGVFARHNNE